MELDYNKLGAGRSHNVAHQRLMLVGCDWVGELLTNGRPVGVACVSVRVPRAESSELRETHIT